MIGLLQCPQDTSCDLLDTISNLREALETFIKDKSQEQKESTADGYFIKPEKEDDADLLSLEGISDEKQILEV